VNGDGRGRQRRAAALASLLAGAGLAAAACSGGPPAAAAGSSIYQKTVAYAQCMRSHGVPDFPDPNSQGKLIVAAPNLHVSPQQAQSADQACRHLLPNGGNETAAQKRNDLSQSLKFAACMRAHGEPKFSDPVMVNGNVMQHLAGDGIDMSSPQYKSAWQACQSLIPEDAGTSPF
jgi:hypothetical protein